MLGQSCVLLESGYKLPAAVTAGITLESHLRQLATAHGIPLEKQDNRGKMHMKGGSDLSNELKAKGVYSEIQRAEVDHLVKLRNEAAHGNASFEQRTPEEIQRMIDGIRTFIGRFPA
jgi:hypothetical protein